MILAATTFGIIILSSSKSTSTKTEVIVAEPLDGAKNLEPIEETTITIENKAAEIEEVIVATEEEPKINEAPKKVAKRPTLEERFEVSGKAVEQNPDNATAHYRYGQVCIELGRYEEGLFALEKAKELGYKNLGNLYYEFGYAVLAREGRIDSDAYDYFEKAKEQHFRNYRKLLYSPSFVALQKNNAWEFMEIYRKLFGENKKAMFKAFLLFGPKKVDNIAFELTTKELFSSHSTRLEELKHPRIHGYFGDFAEGAGEGMFSRSGGNDFRYEMVAQHTKSFITIIYSNEAPWADYLTPRSYHLITFDLEGNKIDELKIAERKKMNRCKTVKVQEDQTIAITEHKVRWKDGWKDADGDLDFDRIKYTKEMATTHYRVAVNGKIVKADPISIGMID